MTRPREPKDLKRRYVSIGVTILIGAVLMTAAGNFLSRRDEGELAHVLLLAFGIMAGLAAVFFFRDFLEPRQLTRADREIADSAFSRALSGRGERPSMASPAAAELPQLDGYNLYEATFVSSVDGSEEPVIVGHPDNIPHGDKGHEPRPLLVGLHSWSTDRYSATKQQSKEAADRGWFAVYPQFRGPNLISNPRASQACASLLAQHDIIDAVEYMKDNFPIDQRRIYIMGGSGGGHIALMMAGKCPDVWAGVSAWVPITSLQEWWEQQNGYAKHIEACCGGKPGDSEEVDFEYLRRSPRTFITNAANTPVRISHGQMDNCIYVQQTWKTFCELANMPGHQISFFSDSTGHHADYAAGASWLESKVRNSKPPQAQRLVTDEAKWYFWCYVGPAEERSLAQVKAGLVEEDGEILLEVKCKGASETKIDLRALGIKVKGEPGEMEDQVLIIRPDNPEAESSYSYPAVRP